VGAAIAELEQARVVLKRRNSVSIAKQSGLPWMVKSIRSLRVSAHENVQFKNPASDLLLSRTAATYEHCRQQRHKAQQNGGWLRNDHELAADFTARKIRRVDVNIKLIV
jgi:hypothetical protein